MTETTPNCRHELRSPDGHVEMVFELKTGIIVYVPSENCPFLSVRYKGKVLFPDIQLGLRLGGAAELSSGFTVERAKEREHDDTWVPVYGERNHVPDRYRELTLTLRETIMPHRSLVLTLRAYNEGVAFRYTVPEQERLRDIQVVCEVTDFHFPKGTAAYAEYRIEGEYEKVPVEAIGKECEWPLTFECPNGLLGCITEAGRYAYPAMRLSPFRDGEPALRTDLHGTAHGRTPFATGWRAVIVGERPGDLVERNFLVDNLNAPCAIEDTSWIRPGKAFRSGLSTPEGLAAVDFAAARGMQYVLFDWGWYGLPECDATDARSVNVVNPMTGERPEGHPGLDIPRVVDYGRAKGVGVWLYVNRHALERQAHELLPLYRSWGIAGIKPGFVRWGYQGWSTWMCDLVKAAAEQHLMVDVHDEYRPTGLCRTYPNLLTVEGIRGNENCPTSRHNCELPFTRYPAGPGDYTPCYYALEGNAKMANTFAHQLALPIIFYSPLMCLYWYSPPSAYRDEPELEIWDHLPTVWDETRCLDGAIGETVTIARRSGRDWYVGTLTNEQARRVTLALDFLEAGVAYEALVCADAAPGDTSRTRVAVSRRRVNTETEFVIELPPNGGHSMRIAPEKE